MENGADEDLVIMKILTERLAIIASAVLVRLSQQYRSIPEYVEGKSGKFYVLGVLWKIFLDKIVARGV